MTKAEKGFVVSESTNPGTLREYKLKTKRAICTCELAELEE